MHRPALHDPATLQDQDAIADLCRHTQIVSHHDHGAPRQPPFQQLQNLRLNGGIQGGGGLIRDQQRRVIDRRQGHHRPLAQAAR